MAISKKAVKLSEPTVVETTDENDVKPGDLVDGEYEESDYDVSTDNFSSSDDSEDEVVLNRSGSIPGHWYESEEHRGYDIYGKKVVKTLMSSKIDELLKNAEDPNRWRTVQDLQNEREVYLTDADIEIIRRLRAGQYPDGKVSDEGYFVEYDDAPHQLHPVRNKDLPKSRFLASKDETKEIRRLVKLIRAGKLVPRPAPKTDVVFDIWAQSEEEARRLRGPSHLPAPKMPLPGHAESYHPPEEFLFNEQEKEDWLAGDESTRPTTFIPENFPCLRRVPWYQAFITERFSRCLDLYSVPRMLKKKMNVDPESLIPKLPQVADLRPFPSSLSVEFLGHESSVLSVCVSPSGDWLASVSTDSVRVWDVMTGKCLWTASVLPNGNSEPTCLAWHPILPLLAIGDSEGCVHFAVLTSLVISAETETVVADLVKIPAELEANWKLSEGPDSAQMLSFAFGSTTPVSSLSWHHKGNFVAAVSAQSPSREKSCCVIAITTKKHVSPLKGKGQSIGGAKHVVFHPSKPYLVVAGSSNVAIFDLKTQNRVKTLNSNSNSVSSVAVHPAGDGMHIIASSLDCKVIWFDSEVRDKPWKNFRHHSSAVRKVAIHARAGSGLPLMATAGDDKAAHVVYSKVYVDDHPSMVKDCQWHPTLPWLFTACDDGIVRLWA